MKYIYCIILSGIALFFGCSKSGNESGLIKIMLEPASPGEQYGLKWSPKGEKLQLRETEEGLMASLSLGPEALPPVHLLLTSSAPGGNFDRLAVDLDRDGRFGGDEDTLLSCNPSENRGKIWSSFSGNVNIPFEKTRWHKPVVNSYPLSLWYVFDPLEPDAEKVIRYSRRGWMQGKIETDSGSIHILITESLMDGIFNRNDSWAISNDSSINELFQSQSAKGIDSHNWLGEQAYGIDSILPSGRVAWIKPVDPNITRAEEETRNDWLAPDRAAKRSGKKVGFLHDYEYARELAKQRNQNLLIDFETTWCGPCKTMDAWVYTADTVVNAASNIVCVKVDGDENRNLVKKFGVTGYPTMILLSPTDQILKKVSGYQSVIRMVDFLK